MGSCIIRKRRALVLWIVSFSHTVRRHINFIDEHELYNRGISIYIQ